MNAFWIFKRSYFAFVIAFLFFGLRTSDVLASGDLRCATPAPINDDEKDIVPGITIFYDDHASVEEVEQLAKKYHFTFKEKLYAIKAFTSYDMSEEAVQKIRCEAVVQSVVRNFRSVQAPLLRRSSP